MATIVPGIEGQSNEAAALVIEPPEWAITLVRGRREGLARRRLCTSVVAPSLTRTMRIGAAIGRSGQGESTRKTGHVGPARTMP
jgi:hypothetical protein